jgi:hypothetical protein
MAYSLDEHYDEFGYCHCINPHRMIDTVEFEWENGKGARLLGPMPVCADCSGLL